MYKTQFLPREPSINAALFRPNPAEYSRKSFGMYGGEEMLVTLEAKERLVGSVIDRFGMSPTFIKSEFGFKFSVRVMVSPNFYAWVMSFGEDMRIISPAAAIDGMKALIEKISSNYK